MNSGWIAVDLDGTLAVYDGWKGAEHIGEPIPAMLHRVRAWLMEGRDVRIFTARVFTDGSPARNADSQASHVLIRKWCVEHLGMALPVTCEKDYGMIEIWDDRCVQVIPNTGKRADGQS